MKLILLFCFASFLLIALGSVAMGDGDRIGERLVFSAVGMLIGTTAALLWNRKGV